MAAALITIAILGNLIVWPIIWVCCKLADRRFAKEQLLKRGY